MIAIVVDDAGTELGLRLYHTFLEQNKEAELISLVGVDIKECKHCDGCKYITHRLCVIRDDIDWIYPKIVVADTIVVISKIEWGMYSFIIKRFLDKFELIADTTNYVKGNEMVKGMIANFSSMYAIGIKDNISEKEKEIFQTLHKENIILMNLGGKSYVTGKEVSRTMYDEIVGEIGK